MVVTVELTVVGVVQVLAGVVEELGTEDSQTYFLAPLQPTSSQVPELMPSILTQSWLAAVAGDSSGGSNKRQFEWSLNAAFEHA